MNTTLRGRIRDRALATDLLRDLTMLTAATGLAATAGFGWLASMTFAGTASANSAVTDQNATNDGAAPPTVRGTTPNAVATPRPPIVSSGGGSSSGGSVGVSGSRRHAHVSTGSS